MAGQCWPDSAPSLTIASFWWQVREQNRAAAAEAAARKERQKKAAEEKRRAGDARRKVLSIWRQQACCHALRPHHLHRFALPGPSCESPCEPVSGANLFIVHYLTGNSHSPLQELAAKEAAAKQQSQEQQQHLQQAQQQAQAAGSPAVGSPAASEADAADAPTPGVHLRNILCWAWTWKSRHSSRTALGCIQT